MKSILTVAAILAALATPALAEEAAPTTPAPPSQAATVAPVAGAAQPAALPQSQALVPMPDASPDGMAKAKSGCGRDVVYLTN